jgi:hypothetical protein
VMDEPWSWKVGFWRYVIQLVDGTEPQRNYRPSSSKIRCNLLHLKCETCRRTDMQRVQRNARKCPVTKRKWALINFTITLIKHTVTLKFDSTLHMLSYRQACGPILLTCSWYHRLLGGRQSAQLAYLLHLD